LLHANLAVTAAGLAGRGLAPGFGAQPAARAAFLHGRNADLGFGAACGFLEADLEVVAKIGAAIDIGAAASLPEDLAEDVAERVREATEARGAGTSRGSLLLHAGMSEAIIGGALLLVAQNLVSELRFLELLF